MRLIGFYRKRFAHYGHGTEKQAIVGLGGQAYLAKNSQDAKKEFRPYFNAAPVYGNGPSMEDFAEMTPLSVGSPQEVIDKTLTFRESFGDYQRQLFLMDHAGLPLKTVLNQLELLGGEVIPVLRKELEAQAGPGDGPGPDPRAARGGQVRRQAGPPAAPEREPRRQRDRRVPLPGHGRGLQGRLPVGDLRRASADRRYPGAPSTPGAMAPARGAAPGAARTPGSSRHPANDAWEALLSAHASLMRRFGAQDVWTDLSMREYDVLYTLSKCPDPIRLTELNRHVLLSQPALSRMVDRLADRGLVSRAADPSGRPRRAPGADRRRPGRAAPDRPAPRPLGRPVDARRAQPGRAPPARGAVREAGGSRRRSD